MSRQCVWFIMIAVGMFVFIGQYGIAEQILFVNNTLVNLRSGPSTAKDNVIATVPKDTPVEVLAKKGSWYNVRLSDGREGWISSWVLISHDTTSTSRALTVFQPEEKRDISPSADVTDNMVFIPNGMAIIGSDDNEIEYVAQQLSAPREALVDEIPRKTRTIRGFYLDQYEVTNIQYQKFVDDTRYPPPLHWINGRYPAEKGNHPVTFVSLDDARAYAEWAGKRLPTSEEWEFAARGAQGYMFPWGETFDFQQVNADDSDGGTMSVGSSPDDVSPYNIYDMGGNVMEWTITQYQGNKDFFILKGSSWSGKRFEARGANQTPGEAVYQLRNIGFRCAKSVTNY